MNSLREPPFFHVTLPGGAAEQKLKDENAGVFQSWGREYLGPRVPTFRSAVETPVMRTHLCMNRSHPELTLLTLAHNLMSSVLWQH